MRDTEAPNERRGAGGGGGMGERERTAGESGHRAVAVATRGQVGEKRARIAGVYSIYISG